MAYSFTDPFRTLRVSLRISGLVYGAGVGGVLLLAPPAWLLRWQMLGPDASLTWPLRLAGAALLGLGAFFWLTAGESIIRRPVLIVTSVVHGLLALVLLVAYFGGQLSALSLGGQLLLIVLVALALIGTVLPLRYLRTEYQLL